MQEDGQALGRDRRGASDRRTVDFSNYRAVIGGYRREVDNSEASLIRNLSAYVAAASAALEDSDDAGIANDLISSLHAARLFDRVFGAMGTEALVFFRHVLVIASRLEDRAAFASVASEALVDRALELASESIDRGEREAAQEVCRLCWREVLQLPRWRQAVDQLLSFPVAEVGLPLLDFLQQLVDGPADESLITFFTSVALSSSSPAVVVRSVDCVRAVLTASPAARAVYWRRLLLNSGLWSFR
jgi:hypothetical protein